MATENKLYAKSSERKRYKIPWQNITGEIQTALTPVEYFATSFIHVHHAGNLNWVKNYILLHRDALRSGK